jgi:hypothetical protein
MTLAERLRKVALFLENEATDYEREGRFEAADDCIAKATELRTLADLQAWLDSQDGRTMP